METPYFIVPVSLQDYYRKTMCVMASLQIAHFLASVFSLGWVVGRMKIRKMVKKLLGEEVLARWSVDYLFLYDLIAQSIGDKAALKLLSYADRVRTTHKRDLTYCQNHVGYQKDT